MLTYTVPAGTDVELFGKLLQEAGVNSSMIVENGVAEFPELTEEDAPAIDAVWATYQERQNQKAQVVAAINANAAFLSKTSPTTAEAVAQVKALTQQMNGLVTILNERGILT